MLANDPGGACAPYSSLHWRQGSSDDEKDAVDEESDALDAIGDAGRRGEGTEEPIRTLFPFCVSAKGLLFRPDVKDERLHDAEVGFMRAAAIRGVFDLGESLLDAAAEDPNPCAAGFLSIIGFQGGRAVGSS